jgi:hypothetical protein
MNRDVLTRKQQSLVHELDELSSLLGLDYQKIKEYERESRTPHLERMKKHFIIGEVITQYTLIDEHLSMHLCHYFFGRGKSVIRLWKTKRFQRFNYHVLEELSLLAKLRFVKSFMNIPKPLVSDIERINALRNGLAHAFFPENLKKSKPIYKGKNIFSSEGVRLFMEDMGKITDFFLRLKS